jgi:multisubunit Na+/H+ antiporter MnhC subunit
MRAICGAIITAGALIGLGLTALGIGTRYQSFADLDRDGNIRWLTFKTMDTPLTLVLVLLITSLVVGVAIAFLGLAFHHQRRYHEMLHHNGTVVERERTGSRLPV